MRKHLYRFLFLLSMIFLVSCSNKIVGDAEVENMDDIREKFSFSVIQQKVFTPTCAVAGCHIGTTAPQGLDLSAGKAYGNLVNVASREVPSLKRVEPRNSRDSYLVIKLEGTDPRMKGARMPANSPALSKSVIDSIKAWIDRGAPND